VGSAISDSDASELSRCVEKHAKRLFGAACFMTRGDRALAEDLVQDAFHAAAANWPSWRGLSDEEQYRRLRQTLRNLAVSTFRHNEVVRRKQEQVEARYRPTELDTPRQAFSGMALERFWQLIERLPTMEHLVALMRWRDDMKLKETATELGISEGAVAAHLNHVRQKLLPELLPYVDFLPDDADRRVAHDREEEQHHEQ
jgi:RNA polymerase sigma-70 factor, ECF subfamily